MHTTFLKPEARSSNFSISSWPAGDSGPLGVEPNSNAFAYFNTTKIELAQYAYFLIKKKKFELAQAQIRGYKK